MFLNLFSVSEKLSHTTLSLNFSAMEVLLIFRIKIIDQQKGLRYFASPFFLIS